MKVVYTQNSRYLLDKQKMQVVMFDARDEGTYQLKEWPSLSVGKPMVMLIRDGESYRKIQTSKVAAIF